MLEAKMHGFFRKRCEVDQGGAPLAVLEFGRRESSAFQLQGEPFTVSKAGRREFALAGSGGVYANATLARGRNWTITAGTGQFDVVKPKMFGHEWEVHHGGRQIGVLRKRGWFDRTVETVVEPAMPMPLQLFALHLVMVLLMRQQAAAASSGGGGGG